MAAPPSESLAQDLADDGRPRQLYPLSTSVSALWLWQGAILAALLAVPLTVASLRARSWGLGAATLILVLLLPGARRWASRRYARSFRCALLADGLLVVRGIWWRREIFVPRNRIQHTDIGEGPLSRRFGVATLKVFTAGNAYGRIVVSGLRQADARDLRDRLLGREASAT